MSRPCPRPARPDVSLDGRNPPGWSQMPPVTTSSALIPTSARSLPLAVAAEGARIFDESGRDYIDASSGPLAVSLGHGHPKVLAALRRQFEAVDYVHRTQFRNAAAEQPGRPGDREAGGRPRPRAVRRQRLRGERGRDEGRAHVLGGARPARQAPVRVRRRQLPRQHRRRARGVRPAPVRRPLPRAGPAGRAHHRPPGLPAADPGGQHRRGRVHRPAPRRLRPPRRPPHRRRPA